MKMQKASSETTPVPTLSRTGYGISANSASTCIGASTILSQVIELRNIVRKVKVYICKDDVAGRWRQQVRVPRVADERC